MVRWEEDVQLESGRIMWNQHVWACFFRTWPHIGWHKYYLSCIVLLCPCNVFFSNLYYWYASELYLCIMIFFFYIFFTVKINLRFLCIDFRSLDLYACIMIYSCIGMYCSFFTYHPLCFPFVGSWLSLEVFYVK